MLNRRQFLWGLGGSSMLASAGALGSSLWRKPGAPVLYDRVDTWSDSICQLCPSGCGLRLRKANGSPVTVSGNPLHPVNRGGLCARGGASLQLYYDPDRFAGPVERAASLIGGWSPIEWEAGIRRVVERLRAATPGSVAAIRGSGADSTSQLLGRLVRASGSDWVVEASRTGLDMMQTVIRQMHGVEGAPVYDFAGSDFVMSFDSGILESSPSVMNVHRSFAEMRGAGGRFVHAGPRMGVTGSKADAWLPIRPGTAGSLALGVAHVLIKEGLVDARTLEKHSWRFEDWVDDAGATQPGLKSWILRRYAPQSVADTTGVGWDRIIRTARQFGSARRPLAVGPVGTSTGYSIFDLLAVHTLNVMIGAIDVPGGVLIGRRPPFEKLDANGDAEPRALPDLVTWILEDRKPSISVLFVHDADPVFTSPDGRRVEQALAKVPLVVSTSPVPNDTTAAAHLVLPDALWMERRCATTGVDKNGYPIVSSSPPAVRPRTDARPTADLVIALAKAAGGRLAERLPWSSHDEALATWTEAILESGAGDCFADVHHSTWTQLLERSGWRVPSYANAAELGKSMDERGGWWDPSYYHGEWRRVLAWPRQRIDVQPVRIAAGTEAPEQPVAPVDGDLVLYIYTEVALDTGISGSLPYLQDTASPLSECGWCAVVEINTATATRLGVRQGDRVTVRGQGGSLEAVASLSQAIRPDVVAINAGTGRQKGGRFAAGIGANPLRILPEKKAVTAERGPGRAAVVRPTMVRVGKA
jgi:anaerobic selenocysteine-containing dehydrogenase